MRRSRTFGKGRTLYAAGAIETWDHASRRGVLVALLRRLLGRPFSLEADAHPAVEVTSFEQPERQRIVLHLLNHPQELPPVPLQNLSLRVRLPEGVRAARARVLPDGPALAARLDGQVLAVTLPWLDAYAMLAVELGASPAT